MALSAGGVLAAVTLIAAWARAKRCAAGGDCTTEPLIQMGFAAGLALLAFGIYRRA